MEEDGINFGNLDSVINYVINKWQPLCCEKHEKQQLMCICVDPRCSQAEYGQAICERCNEQKVHRLGQTNHQTLNLKMEMLDYIKSLYSDSKQCFSDEKQNQDSEQALQQIQHYCQMSIE